VAWGKCKDSATRFAIKLEIAAGLSLAKACCTEKPVITNISIPCRFDRILHLVAPRFAAIVEVRETGFIFRHHNPKNF
jgi:hypothetical protein